MPLTGWSIYKLGANRQWLGIVEALDVKAPIEAAAKEFKRMRGGCLRCIWPALKELGKERNLIGHGVWMWTNEERPLVVWHSKFLESPDWVGAEYFDWAVASVQVHGDRYPALLQARVGR